MLQLFSNVIKNQKYLIKFLHHSSCVQGSTKDVNFDLRSHLP